MSTKRILALQARRDAISAELSAFDEQIIERGADLDGDDATQYAGLDAEFVTVATTLKGLVERQHALNESIALGANLGPAATTVGGALVTSDEPIYRAAGGEHDPLLDLWSATANRSAEAGERIARHNEAEKANRPDVLRASAQSDFAGLIVPEYALADFAGKTREGRPFLDSLNSRPLTRGTIKVGKANVGAAAGAQATENTGFTSADVSTTELSLSAKTVSGLAEVSIQSLELGELETFSLFEDLIAAYHQRLDYLAFHGTGASGQHLGVLHANSNVSSINGETVSAFAEHYAVVMQAAADIRGDVFRFASHVVMSSARWFSLASATDSSGRPLMEARNSSPQNVGGSMVAGIFANLPVIVDDNIVMSGEDDTYMLVYCAPELILREQNGGNPVTIRLDEPKAANGTVQFIARGYSIFSAERRTGACVAIEDLTVPEFPALALS